MHEVMNKLCLAIRPCSGNWVIVADALEQSRERATCLLPTVISTCCLVSGLPECNRAYFSSYNSITHTFSTSFKLDFPVTNTEHLQLSTTPKFR